MKKIETKYPKISIITPSYNQGQFISQTIESVLNQNYPNLEYIIMDGASTDNTKEILKSYGEKITWYSEKDSGQAHAINKGIKKSTGQIIAFINSDDVLLPNTLKTVAEYFIKNPKAYWLTGDYFIIDEYGNKIQPLVSEYKKLLRNWPNQKVLSIANFIIQPSTFWRRSLTHKIGFFNESLHYCMDYDYWMRAIHKFPIHIINQPFSLFRIHSNSKGGSLFTKQFKEEHEVVKKYQRNILIQFLHLIHAKLIVSIYKVIK